VVNWKRNNRKKAIKKTNFVKKTKSDFLLTLFVNVSPLSGKSGVELILSRDWGIMVDVGMIKKGRKLESKNANGEMESSKISDRSD